jgi:hypothetical protein
MRGKALVRRGRRRTTPASPTRSFATARSGRGMRSSAEIAPSRSPVRVVRSASQLADSRAGRTGSPSILVRRQLPRLSAGIGDETGGSSLCPAVLFLPRRERRRLGAASGIGRKRQPDQKCRNGDKGAVSKEGDRLGFRAKEVSRRNWDQARGGTKAGLGCSRSHTVP